MEGIGKRAAPVPTCIARAHSLDDEAGGASAGGIDKHAPRTGVGGDDFYRVRRHGTRLQARGGIRNSQGLKSA